MESDIPESNQFLFTTEIGLGAWSWGDRMVWNYGKGYSDADIEAGFNISLENGVHFVDTAEVYGNGRSERLLGQFLKQTKTPVIVATKFFPLPWRWTKASLTRALRRSLERLDLERVDLYQIHWPSPLIKLETYVEGLAAAHSLGLTRAVGVSNYDKTQMQRAYNTLSKYEIPLASNQVEFHLLNRSAEKNGLLKRCQELGVRLIAYSPLAMGLLTGKYGPENPPPRRSLRGTGRNELYPGSRGRRRPERAGAGRSARSPEAHLRSLRGSGHGPSTRPTPARFGRDCPGDRTRDGPDLGPASGNENFCAARGFPRRVPDPHCADGCQAGRAGGVDS